MKTTILLPFAALSLTAATLGHAGIAPQLDPSGRFAAGELLVRWKDGPESRAAAEGNASVGATVKRNFSAIGWQRVVLPQGLSVADGLAAYQKLGTVLAVEPNGATRPIVSPSGHAVPGAADSRVDEVEIDRTLATPRSGLGLHGPSPGVIPNDPRFNSQWNLQKIGMTNAWAVTTGSPEVVVAVIDSGVNYWHEDLRDNMWRNPGESGLDDLSRDRASNGVDDDANGYVDDVYGIDAGDGDSDPMDEGFILPPAIPSPFYHGTMVAGIIGAAGNNTKGVAGINWAVRLMALKDESGGDELDPADIYRFNSQVIECVNYVLMMKRRGINVRVVNNSYLHWARSRAVEDAIRLCSEEGILFVFAAGNGRADSDSVFAVFSASANLPNALSVAASDQSDNLLVVSAEAGSTYGQTTVDLAAPGPFSISTTDGSSPSAYTGRFGFTSGAAPHVTGAAALLWAAKPQATVEQVTAALLSSVDHPVGLRGKLRTQGRLNVARALQVLANDIQPTLVLHALPHNFRTTPGEPLQVFFNQPMDRASVETGLQITPAASGQFSWTADSRTLTFTPNTAWPPTNHSVRILGTVHDASGGSLDGNYDLAPQGSPSDDFVWTFRFPLPNDDFAGAQPIAGESGQAKGTNRGTTLEVDEPFFRWSGMATVWYQWQPPRSGPFTFDLMGTAFDTMLDVFVVEGPVGPAFDPPFGRMKSVAHNNDYGTRKASRVSFLADAATNYWVRVNGTYYSESWMSAMANFTLSWSPTPAPRLTSFTPSSGPPGMNVTLVGADFTLATAVEFSGVGATFSAVTNSPDQRLVAVVPGAAVTGPICITTPAGTVVSQTDFVVPAPVLAVQQAANDRIELSWPGAYAGWELQVAPGLTTGAVWANVLPPGAVPDVSRADDWVVTVPAAGGQGLFRLIKRP